MPSLTDHSWHLNTLSLIYRFPTVLRSQRFLERHSCIVRQTDSQPVMFVPSLPREGASFEAANPLWRPISCVVLPFLYSPSHSKTTAIVSRIELARYNLDCISRRKSACQTRVSLAWSSRKPWRVSQPGSRTAEVCATSMAWVAKVR